VVSPGHSVILRKARLKTAEVVDRRHIELCLSMQLMSYARCCYFNVTVVCLNGTKVEVLPGREYLFERKEEGEKE
jgi:hypothetical protein